ncbi:MAG: hypothetical protein Q7V57_12245 [Actinomycetota bacterium]|nr:hypothetical protein [Actinomycetota bacterium]
MKRPTNVRGSAPVVPRWLGRAWAASAPEHHAEVQRFLRFSRSKGSGLLTVLVFLGVLACSIAFHVSRNTGWPDGGDSAWIGGIIAVGLYIWINLGFVGARIGRNSYRTVEGYVLGILLGPLGWLVTLLLPHRVVSAAAPTPLPPPLSS